MLMSCESTDNLFQQTENSSVIYRVTPKEAGNMALSITTALRGSDTRSYYDASPLTIKKTHINNI